MATTYWIGQAPAVAQTVTVEVTAYDAATTYALAIGGVAVSVPGTTDESGTAAALAAAWNASTDAYFTGITASASGDTITLTADVPGVPFAVSSSASGGAGAIGAPVTVVAASGPNHWDAPANWSGGAAPATGDDVIIAGGPSICFGLAQPGVSLNSLTILKSYTGRIGLNPEALATSADGAATIAGKREYREIYLAIHASVVGIGVATFGTPAGSGRINLDLGPSPSIVTVHDTGAASVVGQGAVNLKAASSSTDIIVRRTSPSGGVGIAALVPGETSTIRTLDVSADGSPRVVAGPGCALTNALVRGGAVHLHPAGTVAKVQVHGGTVVIDGPATIAQLDVLGGAAHPRNAAVTTLNAHGGVTVASGGGARAWGTVNVFRGASVQWDSTVVTVANPIAGNIIVQGAA